MRHWFVVASLTEKVKAPAMSFVAPLGPERMVTTGAFVSTCPGGST